MRGRQPLEYRLREGDRQAWQARLADGQLSQRVAQRAQALFALDRGERIGAMVHWLGWSRTGRWELWQRDHAWGIDAAFEAARSGRPPVFSPLQRVQIERVACTAPPASGLQRARGDCRSLHEVVVEQAIGGSIHYPTVARILAQARLQPPRRRSWKTATIDERFLTQAEDGVAL